VSCCCKSSISSREYSVSVSGGHHGETRTLYNAKAKFLRKPCMIVPNGGSTALEKADLLFNLLRCAGLCRGIQ